MRFSARGSERGAFLLGASVLVVLLLALGNVQAADGPGVGVEELDRLIDAGAASLVLRIIDRDQPPLTESAVRWQRFERRRLEILASRRDWAALIGRVRKLPPSVPDDFWTYAHEMLARAELAKGDAHAATTAIAGLIWGSAQDTAMTDERSARLERWRAMLAESYLLGERMDDARTTVLRYRLDYGDAPAGWRLLRAKALIRSGDGAKARDVLAGLETTETAYLRLLVRAREGGADPVDLLVEMTPFLGEGRLTAGERSQLWAALAGSAAGYHDNAIRATAMEQAVALATPVEARDRLVRVDADALWEAYEAYAAALANDARLLVGRFDDWLALARRYDGAGDVRARALYAYLGAQKRDAGVAGAARTALAEALAGQSRGLRILAALYLDSTRYPRIADIPSELRAPLVAYAVASSRRDVAGELLAGLDAQARRALRLRWRTPVAVALIETGRVEEALSLFAEGDAPEGSAPDAMGDALARLALALQSAGEYEHSARFAARALAHTRDPARRRALLLLGAESESYAGRNERAARLYLASAEVSANGSVDARSRAARLEAARALARAGLDADALAVLERTPADGSPSADDDLLGQLLRRY